MPVYNRLAIVSDLKLTPLPKEERSMALTSVGNWKE